MGMNIENPSNTLTLPITFTTGRAFTATAYEVGRNADGTNQMQFNVPTSAGFEFSVNDIAQVSVIDGAILPTTDNDIDLGSGSYQFKDAYINGTLEADAITIGGTNVVTGSLITTLGTISAGEWQGTDVGVAYGGTGVSTLTANGVLVGNGSSAIGSIDMSTKGHVLIGDGSGNPQMLGVGTDTHVLTADSGETTGVKWAAPAAAAAGSLTGSTLASGVTASSLTSVGTLTGLGLSGDISMAAAATVWSSGVAAVAGEYSIQRDVDSPNQLHFNVPTGAGYEFSINDSGKFLITTNGSIRLAGGGAVGSLDFAYTFDTDTGFFRPNPDQVTLVAAGVAIAGWDAKGLNTGGLYTARSSQQPTRAINLFNGQPPIGTLADGATVYSESGQMNTMDSAGVAMRLSGGTIDTSSGDLTLNPAGNIYTADDVGIGITAADVLHVRGTKNSQTEPYLGGISIDDDQATEDENDGKEGVGGAIIFRGKYNQQSATSFAAIHAYKNDNSSRYEANLAFNTRIQGGGSTEKMRITYDGSVQIGGTASHGTTRGTGILSLFNVSQAPVGTLANGAAIYCEGGVMKVINADGSGGTIDFS